MAALLLLAAACGRLGYDRTVGQVSGGPQDGAAGVLADASPPFDMRVQDAGLVGWDAPAADVPARLDTAGTPDAASADLPASRPDLAPDNGAPVRDAMVGDDGPPLTDPRLVSPSLRCGLRLGPRDFLAVWGAKNTSSRYVTVPVGDDNYFSPAPVNRGQPTLFPPGIPAYLFAHRFAEATLVWALGGKTGTASDLAPRCTLSADRRFVELEDGSVRVAMPPPP